jgi:ABC-type enterochelin transport system permease subunit
MPKLNIHIYLFFTALLATSFALGLYGSWQAPISRIDLLLTALLSALMLSVAGAITFSIGNKYNRDPSTNKGTILSALFTYFLSYTICTYFGLFEVSWYTFLATVTVLAFLSGLRLSGVPHEQKR